MWATQFTHAQQPAGMRVSRACQQDMQLKRRAIVKRARRALLKASRERNHERVQSASTKQRKHPDQKPDAANISEPACRTT